MQPERADDILSAAERPLARHSAELVRKGPEAADLVPLLAQCGQRLARRLSAPLAPLLGLETLNVRASSAREGTIATIRDAAMSPLNANSLMMLGQGGPALFVQMEPEPVLRMVDRAFGGRGVAPTPLPKAFPPAADLMIGRLERLIAAELAIAIGAVTANLAGCGPCPAILPNRRNGDLGELEAFAEDEPLAILPFEVEDDGVLPWALTIALPVSALPDLFGSPENAAPPAPRTRARATDAPFADLPLGVTAVLVDMAVPFGTIARLAPGQVLPIVVARQVPLSIDDQVFAHGTVGAVDDRVALQITQAFED